MSEEKRRTFKFKLMVPVEIVASGYADGRTVEEAAEKFTRSLEYDTSLLGLLDELNNDGVDSGMYVADARLGGLTMTGTEHVRKLTLTNPTPAELRDLATELDNGLDCASVVEHLSEKLVDVPESFLNQL